MIYRSFSKIISAKFAEHIYHQKVAHANEFYLDVNPKKLREIATYIYQELTFPLISIFANDERNLSGKFALYYVFAERKQGLLIIIKTSVSPEHPVFTSIAVEIPGAAAYEREIHDLFGLFPLGHPDPKKLVFHSNWPEGTFPLRKDFNGQHRPPYANHELRFTQIMGEGVYEIPVGPVHAGIIEPGHFRFSVAGEPIINLEAQLFFVHKGIEKMCEGRSIEHCLYVAERISGDETFANSQAYCQAIEKIAHVTIPERAMYTRVIFGELERLTSHLGDLAGICQDVAYGFAASQFNMMRGWAYNLADELCGMRFLRSVNKLGGCRLDFVAGKEKKILQGMKRLKKELTDTITIIQGKSMFIDRVEHTGILDHQIAVDLNTVGPGGRASGILYDVRKSFPYEVYDKLHFSIPNHKNGDVNCRTNVKIEECLAALEIIYQAIEGIPQGKIREPLNEVPPYQFAFGLTESPRGENVHWIMTGEHNTLFRYKIRTPSFCNWPAVCHAVKGNIVPDFPLINKSFNLSYAGNDL